MKTASGFWTIALCGVAVISPGTLTLAQLVPDNTLGAEGSIVNDGTANGLPTQLIEGGATRGVNLFHSFGEFNVGNLQQVYFANPDGIANILTRVTGSNVSNILGTLGVNGGANLFLLNPNGIIFGENAQLDVRGSFVASTAESFLFPDGSEFSATNPDAPPLLTVNVPLGLQYGTNRPQGDISNAGDLAVGARQSLTLFGNTVTSTGDLSAPGGTVQLLGNRVGLLEQAKVDVSSPTGGGTVLIGGDYQGQGTVPNALRTFVGEDVAIHADGLMDGDGGMVIVWADEVTRFYGNISARGGEISGNGGFVEVSGKQSLDFQGQVNTLAPNGNAGTLLLDPTDITVINGAGSFLNLNQVDEFADPDIGANTIDAALINAATTNVILQATNNINFDAAVNITTPGVGLTAEAGNDINVNPTAGIVTNGGDINLIADADNTGEGALNIIDSTIATGGGNFTAIGRGNATSPTGIIINNSTIDAGPGNISMTGSGWVDVSPDNHFGIFIFGGSQVTTTESGTISLDGRGGNGESATFGIQTLPDTTIISSVDGNIVLKGIGGDNPNATNSDGIFINSVVESSGDGNIIINGIGGAGANSQGVAIPGTGRVKSRNGNIEITGVGDGSRATRPNLGPGPGDQGILVFDGGVIESTGTGTITLNGTGGNGMRNYREGIRILSPGSRISSVDGNIIFNGTGGGGASDSQNNHGIRLDTESLVQSTGTGSIEMIGIATAASNIGVGNDGISVGSGSRIQSNSGSIRMTGIGGVSGNGSDGDQGIALLDDNTQIRSVNGDIFVQGTSRGTGNRHYGILIADVGALVQTTGTGNITIEGIINGAANDSDGIFLRNGSLLEATGTGDISLTADEIAIDGFPEPQLRGNRNLILQPYTPSLGINLGSATNDNRLNLSAGELNALQDGFSQIVIGRNDGSGLITVEPPGVLFNDNVTLQSPNPGGSILVEGNILTFGNSNITLTSGATLSVNNSDIRSTNFGSDAGGDITLTAPRIALNNGANARTLTAGSGKGGDIHLTAQSITLTNDADIVASTILNDGRAGNINVNAANTVTLLNGSQLISTTLGAGDAGDVNVNTRRLPIQNNQPGSTAITGIGADALLGSSGNAGNLTVNVSESIEIIGNQPGAFTPDPTQPNSVFRAATVPTGLTVATRGSGKAGILAVTTGRLILRDGAGITSSSVASGDGGNLNVKATLVELEGLAGLAAATVRQGNSGNLRVEADRVVLRDGATFSADTVVGASGNAGDLTIATNQLSLFGGARVGTTTSNQGASGNLTVNAADFVRVVGTSADGSVPSSLLTSTFPDSTGIAGDLTIATRQVIIEDGGAILTSSAGGGRGGDLSIAATESITLRSNSQLSSETSGTGSAGNVALTTPILRIEAGAAVSASTVSTAPSARAGNVLVNASRGTILRDRARLSSESTGAGSAGNLTINTRLLEVSNQSQVAVSSTGTGNAGLLEVNAENIRLTNQGRLNATIAAGEGGNVRLQVADSIILRDNSEITAEALGTARGGNIEMTVGRFVLAILAENSDIVASSIEGDGGQIMATAEGVFGFRQFNGERTPESDFTASSELGIDGTVAIEAESSINIPEIPNVVSPPRVAKVCDNYAGGDGGQGQASFIVTGRGGKPPGPEEISGNAVWEDLRPPTLNGERQADAGAIELKNSGSERLVEAQGWVVGANGNIILTAEPPSVTLSSSPTRETCSYPRG